MKKINRTTMTSSKKHGHRKLWLILAVLLAVALLVAAAFFFCERNRQIQAKIVLPETASSELDESLRVYSGMDTVTVNGGVPFFTQEEVENTTGENYSELDSLGRCGPAIAMLDRSMMPTEARGEIGQIKPTGWHQGKYEGLVDSDPPYLYNRCHLIAYALSGENANESNLITGTRYMNATTMLPWETQVMEYLDSSENHVLYRVTPLFVGEELLARGVEMEAYSVEDQGQGLCFHVIVYNIQPGVEIDYATGENRQAAGS